MSQFQIVKTWLVENVGLARDALHVHVGLLVFFAIALILRTRLDNWRPWTAALVVTLAGEAWDLRDALHFQQPIDLWASWKDVWNTLFWPSVILLLARFTPLLRR